MGVLDVLLDGAARRAPLREGWDEELHPRDLLGQFAAKVAGLKRGEEAATPGGVIVRHRGNRHTVRVGSGKEETVGSPSAAAARAMDLDAQQASPASLGGKAFANFDTYSRSREETAKGTAPTRADAKTPKARAGHETFEHELPDGTVERRTSKRKYTHVVTGNHPQKGRRGLLAWSGSEGAAGKTKREMERRGFVGVKVEPVKPPKRS